MTVRKKSTRKKTTAKTPARAGRPKLARAEWNAETYKFLAHLAGFSPAEMSRELGVSKHLIYCWQSERVGRRPTIDQAAAVAQLLSANLGRRIKPGDLARGFDQMKIVFSR